MIRVGIEDRGYALLCHACTPDILGLHEVLYVVLCEVSMLRLCTKHLNELINLALDALGEP